MFHISSVAHWSTGFIVATVILSILFVIGLVMTVLGGLVWRATVKEGGHMGAWGAQDTLGPVLFTVVGAVILASVFAGGGFGMYPFDAQYHQYRTISGTVAHTNSRFLAVDGGGTDQKFVIQYKGDPTSFFGCEDTRCSLARPGDALSMDCIRTHQYSGGVDGYDCKFRSMVNR